MLIPAISDSYRGVRVSIGFGGQNSFGGDIYFRLEFIGETWRQLLDVPEVDKDKLAKMLRLNPDNCIYETSQNGTKTFVWFAAISMFGDNISMFTILSDIFHRIDIISPIPRGSMLHPAVRSKFKDFIKSYAFKDEKESYTNKSELVPVFRVLDALDMIESGKFEYHEGGGPASQAYAPALESAEPEKPTKKAKTRKTAKA